MLAVFLSSWFLNPVAFALESINVVSAENVYGDVANQLGMPYVHVTSIMNNPSQDPHLFHTSPKVAQCIEQADIVIENGLGYDVWMQKLYVSSNKKAILINVGELFQQTAKVIPVVNPHIWYDPKTIPVFAQIFSEQLILLDPTHQVVYQKNLDNLLKSAEEYDLKLRDDRKKLIEAGNIKVTATEPILGYLIESLGLTMLNQAFQQDEMNEADLTPKEIMRFEKSLNDKRVKCLIYNNQVTNSTTERLKALALENHIPVLGVSEMMPEGMHYYEWMNQTLDKLIPLILPNNPS